MCALREQTHTHCSVCMRAYVLFQCVHQGFGVQHMSIDLRVSRPAASANEICHLRILLSLQSIPVCLLSLSVGFSTVYIMLNCGYFQTFPGSSLPCQMITVANARVALCHM